LQPASELLGRDRRCIWTQFAEKLLNPGVTRPEAEPLELSHVAVAQLTTLGGDDDPIVPVPRLAVGPDELAGHAEVEDQTRLVAAVSGLGFTHRSDQPLAVPPRRAKAMTDQGLGKPARRDLTEHTGIAHVDVTDATASSALEHPTKALDIGQLRHTSPYPDPAAGNS
jgi:hypothetical protein